MPTNSCLRRMGTNPVGKSPASGTRRYDAPDVSRGPTGWVPLTEHALPTKPPLAAGARRKLGSVRVFRTGSIRWAPKPLARRL